MVSSPSASSSNRRPTDTSPRVNSAETRPTKRNRITIACTSCRQRKSRCDGSRPRCSTCKDYGLDCAYANNSTLTKTSASKELIEALQARIACLENDYAGLATRVSKIEGLESDEPTHTSNVSHPSILLSGAPQSQPEGSAASIPDLQDPADGMGSMVFTEEEDSGYFGPSSNIAFTRRIVRSTATILKNAASDRSPVSPEDYTITSHVLRISRPPSPVPVHPCNAATVSIGTEPFILPPREETLRLIELYFSATGILFPYIDKESFLQTYQQLSLTDIVSVRRSWLGLLNVVLAMATSANTFHNGALSAQERASKSDIFFRRARSLCDRQIRHGASLEIVQLLLLMSQYLQGSERSIETWNIHGLAVKAAYQLGLHSSDALRHYPPLEREFRKRTWYGCIILDRTLSMTMGRPVSIPEQYVKVEVPQPLAGSQSEDEVSVQFFTATITLYRIMTDVFDVLYGSNLGCVEQVDVFETASYLLKCEQKFFTWQRDLPLSVSLVGSNELQQEPNEFIIMRLRVILTLRFLNLRILAHRPLLCMYLESLGAPQVDPLQLATLRQVSSNSVQLCVQSATVIVKITTWALKHSIHPHNLLGAWWFSLYYTFNASLVLYSALLIQNQTKLYNQPLGMEQLHLSMDSLHQANECLSMIFKGNRIADKCVRYVSALSNWLSIICMPNDDSEFDISGLPDDLFERFSSHLYSHSTQPHESLHFFDSTDSHLGLGSNELLNPADFTFMSGYTGFNFT